MSSEFHDLSELSRNILRQLARGWLTVDPVKTRGILTLDELAAELKAPADSLREHLTLLESMGHVANAISSGIDPTMEYKRLSEVSAAGESDETGRYYITESGKRLVATEMSGDTTTRE